MLRQCSRRWHVVASARKAGHARVPVSVLGVPLRGCRALRTTALQAPLGRAALGRLLTSPRLSGPRPAGPTTSTNNRSGSATGGPRIPRPALGLGAAAVLKAVGKDYFFARRGQARCGCQSPFGLLALRARPTVTLLQMAPSSASWRCGLRRGEREAPFRRAGALVSLL